MRILTRRKRGDDFRRDLLRLYGTGLRRIYACPDTLLESFDRELAAFQNSVPNGETAAAPFIDFAFHRDFVIEPAGKEEVGARLDERHPNDAELLTHRESRMSRSREELA